MLYLQGDENILAFNVGNASSFMNMIKQLIYV